jgi:ABC-type enterochelin transport system ATPase subunit
VVRASSALKLTVAQRLGFEITLARARIERAYKQMQDDLHAFGRYPDSTGIALHEAEQILAALERVSGDFYRRSIESERAYRDEQKRNAAEDAKVALAQARSA